MSQIISFLLFVAVSFAQVRFGPLAGLTPQICLKGKCHWVCPSPTGANCKGIYYCGPDATECVIDCPKGGCNAEMALISHSKGKTIVNCHGEATCSKMLVNCGIVDPEYIHNLNNLPGTLQNLFEHIPRSMFGQQMHAPYGQCTLNCGFKSCHDIHYICQGQFQNGAGCGLTAVGRPSFENGAFHCGLPNPKSHCQANCGMSLVGSGSLNPLLFNLGQQGGIGSGNEPPCHNGRYVCFQGQCYCDGIGCGHQDFQSNGLIRLGRAPKLNLPKVNVPPKPKPKAIPPKPQPKPKTPPKKTVPQAVPRRVSRFIMYHDQPLRPGVHYGFTHFNCGSLTNCKILCENRRECSGITIEAGPTTNLLVVECAEEACVGLKVESNAIENEFKCIDNGACAGANFVCGVKQTAGQTVLPNMIESCRVDCQNGGCSRHNNPSMGFNRVKGLRVECNQNVLLCTLNADSQNANFNQPQFGMIGQPNIYGMPEGSFGGGEFVCNVRRAGMNLPFNPMFPSPRTGGMPRCVLKCSTNIVKRFCRGVKYICKANQAQCQCEDFCTSHMTECFQQRISKDCPRRSMPTPRPTAHPTKATTAAKTTIKGTNGTQKTTV